MTDQIMQRTLEGIEARMEQVEEGLAPWNLAYKGAVAELNDALAELRGTECSLINTPLEPWVNLFANHATRAYAKEEQAWSDAIKADDGEAVTLHRGRMAAIAQDFGEIVREYTLARREPTETQRERMYAMGALALLPGVEDRGWLYEAVN